MRKSVLMSVVLPLVISVAALLWLLWAFFPLANGIKGGVTLVLLIAACRLGWWRAHRFSTVTGRAADAHLPPQAQQGPVVLVCGDGLDALFSQQAVRVTTQGCWLKVGDVGALSDVVRNIQWLQPHQLGQLSIMYACLPDRHQDEAVLRAALKDLRQQARQLRTLTGCALPIILSCQFSGPETPWTLVRGDNVLICPAEGEPFPLHDGLQTADNLPLIPVLSQAFAFIRAILLDELEKADRFSPPAPPFAVVLRLGAPGGEDNTLWSRWLFRRTNLQFPVARERKESPPHFVDLLLPLLAPFAVPVQGGQTARRVVILLSLCAMMALGFSVFNNRTLISRVSVDLQRWQVIPMAHAVPKAQALVALKQHVLLLERWQRQGEPLRYGLGLYPGQRLWLALQQAIDTYVPPAPEPSPSVPPVGQAPQTVRLDALSLFDPGQAVLKPGSTKMLVNALVDIKGKPGWLIVVAGHTDSTGDTRINQQLSLKRAEALRDWMLYTSDVSPTCFAVQGYGASRPAATNETPAGRAANRRVEISLVPQADACQAAVSPSSSNE